MSRSLRAPAGPGLRVSGRWLVVGALIGAVAGLLWGLSDRPNYEAVATVIVTDGENDTRFLELARSEEVSTTAAALLGDDVAGADLVARTTFSAADGGRALVVRSRATFADFAAAAADAFAAALIEVAGDREPGRNPLEPGRDAELPTEPEGDRAAAASTLVGAGVGAVLGTLLALAGRAVSRRSTQPGRPAEGLGIPELGLLTDVEDAVWATEPGVIEIEGGTWTELAVLAEKTGLERREWMPRALALAGLSHGVGPSRAIVGLAGVVAARGRRVVVLEADLGYPRLAPLLGIANEPGLAEHLAGESGPREVMRTIRVSGKVAPEAAFVCVPAGAAPAGRPRLVERRFADLVGRLGRVYDLVLVLAPPLLDAPAARVAANVGEGLICLEQGHAVAPDQERATELLEGMRLLGSVLLARAPE